MNANRSVRTSAHCSPVPAQRRSPAAAADLAVWRARHEAAVRSTAVAPVRFVPAAFVEALQGAWGELEPVEAAALVLVRRVCR